MFLNIRVIPSARLDRLEEVLVVTKIQEKLPDTKDLGPIRASDILSERLPGVPADAQSVRRGRATRPDAGEWTAAQSCAASSARGRQATAAEPGTPSEC